MMNRTSKSQLMKIITIIAMLTITATTIIEDKLKLVYPKT
jgi:hypothetical protein